MTPFRQGKALEGEALVVVIVDDSRAFDPSLATEPDVDASVEDRDLGGLGLFLVQQMMDGVAYQRIDDCNVVTLTKNTSPARRRRPEQSMILPGCDGANAPTSP